MQVRYVNKALQRFESTQVIPIQFVMFTLCVIIGSAVLYRDFERTTAEQAVKFVGGCLLTFFGVFLVTSGRYQEDDEDTLSDMEGVEETIGLAEQGPNAAGPQPGTPRGSVSSRRSSRASRVSFVDLIAKPLSMQRDTGVPSLRIPGATNSKTLLDSAPVLSNPWQGDGEDGADQAGMRSSSSDSVPAFSGASSVPSESSVPSTPVQNPSLTALHANDQPVTPRASQSTPRPHSRHYHDLLISPSPLSSTVTAVIKDTFQKTTESALMPKSSIRRIRSTIRASLYMPDDDGDEERAEPSSAREEYRRLIGSPADEFDPSDSNGIRRRARSLSNTLGEFFGVKKKKQGLGSDSEGAVTDEEIGPERV
jgi:magnesium transporter